MNGFGQVAQGTPPSRRKVGPVWLIDDDPINNLICAQVLTKSEFSEEITEFERAMLALDQLLKMDPQELPEVIFLDINMPEMTGWEFLEAFEPWNEKNRSKIKVFMLSSSIFSGDKEKAGNYPSVLQYLEKPLRSRELDTLRELYF
jgi:CheY-like chemotaxis protein